MTYDYDEGRYRIQVTFTGWFCLFIAIACVVLALPPYSIVPILMVVLAVVAVYGFVNTFVTHSYPKRITIDDDAITFESFGRTDTYRLDQVTFFSLREQMYDSAYVRIKSPERSGRYFIRGEWFTDGKQLNKQLCAIDERINPDSLRVKARRGGIPTDQGNQGKKKYGKGKRK